MLERITTLKTPGPIRSVVGSPGGGWVVVVREEATRWSGKRLTGAALYRRCDTGLERTGEPAPAATMFVLDDGLVVAVHDAYNEIEVVRCTSDGAPAGGFVAIHGLSLGEGGVALEADGEHLTIATVDRDDGHGWSQPIYTPRCVRAAVRTGQLVAGEAAPHLLRGPGVATRSPHVGGDAAALQARIDGLPFRTEWPLRVGPRRLLTTTRVIDVASGATVLGPRPALFDLSADERLAVGADTDGRFELIDVERGAVIATLDPKYQVSCAAFLGPRELVVGTAEGRVLLLGLP